MNVPEDGFKTTLDALLGGRVRLRQPVRGYRAAIDPVLLAAAAPARPGWRVLDVGTGSGAAALCLAARVPDLVLTGLEAAPDMALLARENAALQGCPMTVIEGDVALPPATLEAASFDLVITNPPYAAHGTVSPEPGRARAHREGTASLRVWVEFCLAMLRPKGWLVLVHRAERLDEIMAATQGRAGAVTLIPLWPRTGVAAKRVIVRARKGVRSPAGVHPGLVLHDAGGDYTPQAEAVLRDAAPIL